MLRLDSKYFVVAQYRSFIIFESYINSHPALMWLLIVGIQLYCCLIISESIMVIILSFKDQSPHDIGVLVVRNILNSFTEILKSNFRGFPLGSSLFEILICQILIFYLFGVFALYGLFYSKGLSIYFFCPFYELIYLCRIQQSSHITILLNWLNTNSN